MSSLRLPLEVEDVAWIRVFALARKRTEWQETCMVGT